MFNGILTNESSVNLGIDKSNKMYYKYSNLSTFYCLNCLFIFNIYFLANRQNFSIKDKNITRKK